VLVSVLIITFFAGIGYQLRRWLGPQPWYMGVGFVVVLYMPAFLAVLVGGVALGAPFTAARQAAVTPVLSGLIVGAVCLCSSDQWAPLEEGDGRPSQSG
jgi:hypothetical protein